MNLRDTRRMAHKLAGAAVRRVMGDPAAMAVAAPDEWDRERLLDSLREMAERHEHFAVEGKRRRW